MVRGAGVRDGIDMFEPELRFPTAAEATRLADIALAEQDATPNVEPGYTKASELGVLTASHRTPGCDLIRLRVVSKQGGAS